MRAEREKKMIENDKKMIENDKKILKIQEETKVHHEEVNRAERIRTKLEELLS